MFSDLISTLETSLLSDTGMVPVVLEGIEHVYEKNSPVSEASSHATHELIYLRDGQIELTIEGKKCNLNKGNTIIIRPNSTHSLKIKSAQADMLLLYFVFSKDLKTVEKSYNAGSSTQKKFGPSEKRIGPSVEIPSNLAPTSFESFMKFAIDGQSDIETEPYIILSGSYKKEMMSIVERIIDEMNENNYSKSTMLQLMTLELMITLSRAIRDEWEETLRVKNGKAKELVLIAKDYIDDNFDRGITVANAAQYVFLSQGYFTRAFREEIGVSPMGYLMKKRIERACELLENKEIKVSGVASQAGFSSPQRFNVAFRKQMGMTPMEYRKLHIGG